MTKPERQSRPLWALAKNLTLYPFCQSLSLLKDFLRYCNIIAEGFQFSPLSLVSWEPFGSAHELVGCNIEPSVNAGAHRQMEVSLRCHNTPRQNGWLSASDVTHRKRAEVYGDLIKGKVLRLDTGRRRLTFGARWRESNLRPIGSAQDGGQMNKTA